MFLFSFHHLCLHHLFLKNDSTSRDVTEGTPIDFSPSPSTDIVDPTMTKQEESKKVDGTSQPSTVERIHKPIAPFQMG